MISRRLLSSLAGSCVFAALVGCNAIVGNEDVAYTETTTTKKNAPSEAGPTVAPANPTSTTDGGIDDASATGDDEDIVITDAAID